MNVLLKTALLLGFLSLVACHPRPEEQSGAGEALQYWSMSRSYPDGKLRSDRWASEFFRLRANAGLRGGGLDSEWQGLGPKNIGGRTLCLAFHPENPEIIYAGSSSGGLWKSETGGEGANAWSYIPTGFPVLGVASIAIDPGNPEVLYIGTGEVYNYTAAQPGVVNRFTRGTYGIGILKSTDGGLSWTHSLDWSLQELTGVADLLINPQNSKTVYAATTEGLYRTYDGGLSWENIHPKSMAVDIDMHVTDTSLIWVSHGNLQSPDRGVFRSENGGQTFELLSNGIPTDFTGKTMLAPCPSAPNRIYASVSDSGNGLGLYVSDDKGDSWHLVNASDVPKYQGWYSHDLAVKPTNPNFLVYCGIDAYITSNGGTSLNQTSYWYSWYLGLTQPGEPEGPPEYVHADIHAVYYHPLKTNTVFLATDGGIFVSGNGGYSWEARNGGYQTQQFYANFANSASDSLFAMGGMQDNATAIYLGQDAWWRVLGGDGMSAAIHPENDSILFGSIQYLNIRRSIDKGLSFQSTLPSQVGLEEKAFNGPFELAPSDPDILYAGAQRLYRSDNLGGSWYPTSAEPVDGDNMILTIAVGPTDPDLVYLSTASQEGGPASVKKSEDGGQTWETMFGLPDRIAMDIDIHPENANVVYIAFSGFGTSHLYLTADGGQIWIPIGGDLPDVPVNSLLIDPLYPSHLYLGNDLGVFASTNGGASWAFYSEALPEAVLAMDLSISPSNRKLRLATHGNGVYENDLLLPETSGAGPLEELNALRLYPNPASDKLYLEGPEVFEAELINSAGKSVRKSIGKTSLEIDLHALPDGIYYCIVRSMGAQKVIPVAVTR